MCNHRFVHATATLAGGRWLELIKILYDIVYKHPLLADGERDIAHFSPTRVSTPGSTVYVFVVRCGYYAINSRISVWNAASIFKSSDGQPAVILLSVHIFDINYY